MEPNERAQRGERTPCDYLSRAKTPYEAQWEPQALGRSQQWVLAGRGVTHPTAVDKDTVPSRGTEQKACLGTEKRLFAMKNH